jgi:hypothetical protein
MTHPAANIATAANTRIDLVIIPLLACCTRKSKQPKALRNPSATRLASNKKTPLKKGF